MKTNDFMTLLAEHPNHALRFQYQPGHWVGANYHLTEVKHLQIDSVDCGAGTDSWNETVLQLWESPSEEEKTEFMSTAKFYSILARVHQMRPIDGSSEVKIEYGNDQFHTAQLFIHSVETGTQHMDVILGVQPVACKAEEACGIPASAAPATENACAPGSGCC
ncbi:DUF6428 family protein [Altibacter sp. HG106]|uniref:DUF6428 family protein n=1 Tax=Altibacter sp. HG106 TaxID=3023937 RepID=UPI002350C555|nr:DUF6428 family protein [Altibacter sp. HG106]MDC7994794.1 DUF6428 family protein [Altibacter sp. HG106]